MLNMQRFQSYLSLFGRHLFRKSVTTCYRGCNICKTLHVIAPQIQISDSFSNYCTKATARSTIDEEELKTFTALANSWWSETGEFEALHAMNKLRIPFIREALVQQREPPTMTAGQPLQGLKIIDAGSGGGLLAEPLARLGATVTGVDPVEKSTKVAQLHLNDNPDLVPRIKYITGTVEGLVETEAEQYDALIASEVVEHVVNLVTFVDACCRLVKPGGSIFVTTINRTMMSKALAVFAAEKIARVVPVGTHDWEKFVPPGDLQYLLDKGGFTTRVVHGMFYNVLQREWCWTDNTSMNYALHAVKSDAPTVDNTCDNVEENMSKEASSPSDNVAHEQKVKDGHKPT